MQDTEGLLDLLKMHGYEAKTDETGVVTVLVDPDKNSVTEISHLIIDVFGWKRSYGFKFKSRPSEWDRKPKAPARDDSAAKTQRKPGKSCENKSVTDDEQLPGQISFTDLFPGF